MRFHGACLSALVLLLSCSSAGDGQYVADTHADDSRPDGSFDLEITWVDVDLDSTPPDVGDAPDLQPDLPGELDLQELGGDDTGHDTADVDDGCGQECEPPQPLWAVSLGGEMADVALAVAVGPDGSTYAGGHTNSKTFHVGGEVQAQIPANDVRQVFVSRLLSDGTPDWTRLIGGEADDRLRAVAPRAAGGVLAAGFTGSTNLVIGAQQFVTAGKFDAWAAALAEDGKVDWALSFGSDKDEILLSIAEDSDGNIFLGGYFSSTNVTVGDLNLTNTLDSEQYDLMVIKLDPAGKPLWARVLGGTGFDYVHSLAVDAAGNVSFLGALSGAGMLFDGEVVTTNGERDVLVGSFTADGSPRWIRHFGGTSHDAGHALAVSAEGDVYITGSLQSAVVDFGGDLVEHIGAPDKHDIFLARLSANGEHMWSHGFGGVDWDLSKCLALDHEGNLYMVGAFFSPLIKLGGEPLGGGGPGNNMSEVFVAAYGLDGSHRWSEVIGGPDDDVAYWVAVGASGVIAFAGSFNGSEDGAPPPAGTMDPGTGPLPTYTGRDSFVVRLK